MKKFLLASLFMLVLVLCISAVSAAVTVIDSFSSSNPIFGDENQMASNPNADEEEDENIYDTGIVSLSNNGTAVTITSIVVDAASGFSTSKLNITMVNGSVTVPANGNATVTFNARIPEELDAVDSDGDAIAFKVAAITLKDGSGNTVASFDAYMQRKNMLEIDKIYVSINDGSSKSYKNGKTVDVERTDSIEVEVKIENKYDDDDDDVEIEDIEINGDIDDSDIAEDEDDVEDIDEDAADLDAEDTDTIELMSFDVSEEADGNYDGTFYVTGDDEHGARHGEKWELEFDVEVETHDIRITKMTLSPGEVSCERTTTLRVEGINLGKRDEDDVRLTVINSNLGVNEEEEYDELENDADDNDFTESFIIDVASSTPAGTYPIAIKLYRDTDDLEESRVINLIVTACTPSTTTDTTSQTTTVVNNASQTAASTGTSTGTATTTGTTTTTTGTAATASTEKSFVDSPSFMWTLIGFNVIAVIAVISIIVMLMPKK